MSDQEVYFQFRTKVYLSEGQPLLLNDIAVLACPIELKNILEKIVLLPKLNNTEIAVSAIQVIEIIKRQVPNVTINVIGDDKVLVHVKKAGEDNKFKIILTMLNVAFAALLLFIGAGLAIMYFHEDVNMNNVHKTIYSLITGEKQRKTLILSIPYSIGLGVGIGLFFGIFNINKKDEKPGPLELEIFQYEKDIESYKKDMKIGGKKY